MIRSMLSPFMVLQGFGVHFPLVCSLHLSFAAKVAVGGAGLFYGGGLHQLGVQATRRFRSICIRTCTFLHYS